MYYTFVADIRANGSYLQPFSKDRDQFRYGEIYAFKTQFDQRHQTILE
jgi:hypothetical protein